MQYWFQLGNFVGASKTTLEREYGRSRKTHPGSCGIPRCRFCGNPRRVYGQVTRKELKADLNWQEMTLIDID